MISAGEAVLELVEIKRREADTMEPYAPDQARVLRKLADEFERVVEPLLPSWLSLRDVQIRTGWSRPTLRKRARDLEASGLARKGPSGEWEIERGAVSQIRARRDYDPFDEVGDMGALAEILGREE